MVVPHHQVLRLPQPLLYITIPPTNLGIPGIRRNAWLQWTPMVPACDEGKYLQPPWNTKFIGGQSIRGMVHIPCLVSLQVPKIIGTNQRWYLCLRTVQTVPAIQSCPHWNTKGFRHEGSKIPNQGQSNNCRIKRQTIQDVTHKHYKYWQKNSTIQHRHSLKGNHPKPKPPQTQFNRVHSVPRHANINSTHVPTPQDS